MKCSLACRFHSRVTWFSKCLNCSLLTSIDCGSMALTVQVMSLPSAPQELCPWPSGASAVAHLKCFSTFDADHRQAATESLSCQSPLKKKSFFLFLSSVSFSKIVLDSLFFSSLCPTLAHSDWQAGSDHFLKQVPLYQGDFLPASKLLGHMIMANIFWL